ncbi:MAG: hypothetical protein AB3N64_00075 [Puniceicoccaceae bacterium]
MSPIEYIVILGYLLLLVLIGFIFKRFSTGTSDFLRGGCKGTWWLVGTSTFMSVFSAWTFTGAAGVAFESGFSVMTIYIGNSIGFFLNFLFIGPWFRQLRATTFPEVISLRFGPVTQRFYAFMEVPTRILYAAVQLYGLGIFCSAVFGFEIHIVIIAVGVVVVVYATSGGRWAVMATDFLQGLILLPITIIVAFLCLREMGGLGGMFNLIEEQGLARDFKIVNGPEQFAGAFTWGWISAMVMKQFLVYNSLYNAPRYFSVKDGREARKAALLAMVMMLAGCFFWFLPPITARLLFADEVLALSLAKPAEASYAIVSMHLLPVGLIGLIVVAILTATMSSMDTGLNNNVAIMIKDLYPNFCRWFGLKQRDDHELLRYSRWYTLVLGVCIVTLALYFSMGEGKGIFDIMLDIGTLLLTPMALPLVWGMFIRKTPSWSALFAVGLAAVPSAMGLFSESLFGQEWLFQTKFFSVFGMGTVAFFFSALLGESPDAGYRSRVAEFFRKMHTPIDFEKEVGAGNDLSQLRTIGGIGLGVSLFVLCLLFIPNPVQGRLAILLLALFLGGVSLLMRWAGRTR